MFIGFEEPTQRGAKGYFDVIKLSIEKLMRFKEFLSILSSFATDEVS